MESLVPGVRICFHNAAGKLIPSGSLWLNRGTQEIIDATNARGFSDCSFIPSETWFVPSPDDLALLTALEPILDWSATVSVIQMAESVLRLFKPLELGNTSSWAELKEKRQRVECGEAVEAILHHLLPHTQPGSEMIVSGLVVNAPGLASVTFDQTNGRFIGLHLDSWDRLPMEGRKCATNRFVLNLGSEDRYFLFINLPVLSIYDYLDCRQRGILPTQVDCNLMIREFMRNCPRYPVVKVRVAPGEAYLAPTENIIHDGCTRGKKKSDVHLTIRGHFTWR